MTDDPRVKKHAELKQRFGLNRLPLEVGPGWYHLVEQFLEEARVAGELDSLEIHQAKEKFGELRIYHNGSRYLHRVSSKLSRLSMGVCELCGEPGRHRTDGRVERTRCDRCDSAYDTDKRSLLAERGTTMTVGPKSESFDPSNLRYFQDLVAELERKHPRLKKRRLLRELQKLVIGKLPSDVVETVRHANPRKRSFRVEDMNDDDAEDLRRVLRKSKYGE